MFPLIHEILSDDKNDFTVTELCLFCGVSRSGYYNWLKAEKKRQEREKQDEKDFELILRAYKKGGFHKGSRRIQMTLAHDNIRMNRKKIQRLMRKFNLDCPIRRANPYRQMAKATKESTVKPNLLNRQFEKHGPRKVLLTDITYIPIPGTGKFAYLSTILDAFTKEILAYRISDNLKIDFVLDTVRDLVENHQIELSAETMIHSDQGSHYTSEKFIDIVTKAKLRQSMSRRGNCWDNAPQESFFGHMKDEISDELARCSQFEEIKALVDRWIAYYNNDRYQMKLAKLAPKEFFEYVTTGVYPLQSKADSADNANEYCV